MERIRLARGGGMLDVIIKIKTIETTEYTHSHTNQSEAFHNDDYKYIFETKYMQKIYI